MAGRKRTRVAKLTIKITHVSWRDGRPRFEPGPGLRQDGWKGEDLRHGKDGAWYTPEECLQWVTIREKAIAIRRDEIASAKAKKRRKPAFSVSPKAKIGTSVSDLFIQFWESPRMQGETVAEGKKTQKPASANTIRDYKIKAGTLMKFDPEIWDAPVEALSQPIIFDLYERLWEAKGIATARGCIAVLSVAIAWGMKRGRVKILVNPCAKLGMETPEPRRRCFTPQEVKHLVAAADAIGRPEIGDCIILGVWTGQRQNDRLAMADGGTIDGRRVIRQNKGKAVVSIPDAPELVARLIGMRERRAKWRVQPVELIVDERAHAMLAPEVLRTPFSEYHYRHLFAHVRKAAAEGIKDEIGRWRLEPMPSLRDTRDQDLRDTAVTWLARASCTLAEICQITGHSMQSAQMVLKHYLSSHPEIADNAIKKLIAWYDAQMEG